MSTKRRFWNDFGKDLLDLGGLATVCVCIGLLLNQMRDQPLPLIYASKEARLKTTTNRLQANDLQSMAESPQIATSASVLDVSSSSQTVDLARFQDLVRSGNSLVLDTRPEIFYRFSHVPRALSLPREDFSRGYANQRVALEAWRNKEVVVYCSNASCEDSQMVADAMLKLGYKHVLVFKGGWEEWTRAGLMEEQQ